MATSRTEELRHLVVQDWAALMDELRQVVSTQAQVRVLQANSMLARKMQGARDALEHSADPVSQAANSLIELIDRLLRQSFPEPAVLDWVRTKYPTMSDLIWSDRQQGRSRPTKRGQALCFLYAGQKCDQPSVLHLVAAAALVESRNRLENLKHSDKGTDDEKQLVRDLISAIEGILTIAIRFGWAAWGTNADLEQLWVRLAA